MLANEYISSERACGRRTAGGVYAETRLSEEGLPLEHFLLCPPQPIRPEQWGLPRNLDFAKLTAESRLVLIHARAVIENFVQYPQPPVLACPTDLHLVELREPCAGLWWHDIPERDLARWPGGDLHHRTLPGGVSYIAFPRAKDCEPLYQPGIFMSLPITNLAVIAGRNPQEEQVAAAVFQAAQKSELPVTIEME